MKHITTFCLVLILLSGLISCSSTSSVLIKDGTIVGKNVRFNTLLKWKISTTDLSGHTVQEQEMSIYVNDKTATFLMDKQAFGNSGEMIDFVIADSTGNYIVAHKDEKGNKRKYILKSGELPGNTQDQDVVIKNFNLLANPSGRKEIYPQLGNLINVTGTEYYVTHPETEVIRTVTLVHTNYCLKPVMRFNSLGLDARLPFDFDYGEIIPCNNLITKESKNFKNTVTQIKLESVMPVNHKININEYKS